MTIGEETFLEEISLVVGIQDIICVSASHVDT